MHHSIRDNQRKFRTRARVKDLDQIHTDMKKGIQAIKHEVAVKGEEVDLPGLGQFYCLEVRNTIATGFKKQTLLIRLFKTCFISVQSISSVRTLWINTGQARCIDEGKV